MSTHRSLAVSVTGVVLLFVAVASCSNERAGTSTAMTAVAVSTTAYPIATSTTSTTTTVPATIAPTTSTSTTTMTTVVPTSAPTTEAPTTTTALPGSRLPLRFDGVGDARFGTEPDAVISVISAVLGTPTADSGWVGAHAIGCDGDQAREVFWNDLRLTFGDTSNVSTGRRHFFAWRYGPPGGTQLDPSGMTTLLGLTVGSSVDDVQTKYPAAHIVAGGVDATPSAQLTDGLNAILTDAGAQGVVTALLGGENCTD